MPNFDKSKNITNILISGGTHGNEMSGIAAVKYWQQNPQVLSSVAPSSHIALTLVNEAAIQARVRYIDEDINRLFSAEKLSHNRANDKSGNTKEQILAQKFNESLGPKGKSKTDFCIDIHNTTTNMGPTLIVLENDDFHQQLARFVKSAMPTAVILVEDYQPLSSFGYFCTVAKQGVMVEVGPQVQGVLRADVYHQTVQMTLAILQFIEHYNTKGLPALEPVEAYRLGTEISYPCDANNQKAAMIHPSLDGNDFLPLAMGQPCFIDFDGNDILWEKETTYPHFIGEAAYDHLNIAFATSAKCLF